jgi:hypothetical protein
MNTNYKTINFKQVLLNLSEYIGADVYQAFKDAYFQECKSIAYKPADGICRAHTFGNVMRINDPFDMLEYGYGPIGAESYAKYGPHKWPTIAIETDHMGYRCVFVNILRYAITVFIQRYVAMYGYHAFELKCKNTPCTQLLHPAYYDIGDITPGSGHFAEHWFPLIFQVCTVQSKMNKD